MMLVNIFGTSTNFAYWGFNIVEHVMDVLYGHHYRIHCLDLEGLRDKWGNRENKPVVVTTDRPDIGLSRLLTTSGFPCLAFIDDPDDAIAAAVRGNGMSVQQAIRFSTQYFCCLGEALPANRITMFTAAYYAASVSNLAEDILRAIVGEVEESVIARVLARIAPGCPSPASLTVRELLLQHTGVSWLPAQVRQHLPEEEQSLIRSVAQAYRPIFEKRELSRLEWPPEMFLTANEGQGRPGDIVMFGPARFFIWGPYLFLPPGTWRATIEFEVADNLSGNEIGVDVCIAVRLVAEGAAVLPAIGMYRFSLDFSVVDPNSPIEIRIQILKGAIEGRFGLRKVSLERVWLNDQTAPALNARAERAPVEAIAAT